MRVKPLNATNNLPSLYNRACSRSVYPIMIPYRNTDLERAESMTKMLTNAEYKAAKELAAIFKLKGDNKESAAEYMLNNDFKYRFAVEVLGNM